MLYAGVDAHKKYSKVVLTDDHGAQLAQVSLSMNSLTRLLSRLKRRLKPGGPGE
jgi:hypothetical protein